MSMLLSWRQRLACGTAVTLIGGCGLGVSADAPTPAPVPCPPAFTPADPPGDVQLKVIPDPSGSVDRAHLRRSLEAVAAAVRAWPVEPQGGQASAARPGLTVSIRAIGGQVYGPSGELLAGRVPAIPAVPAPPSEDSCDVVWDVVAHDTQLKQARIEYRSARAKAEDLARQVLALNPQVTFCSDIWGAISAAAETFPRRGQRKLVVMSDLAQDCAAQISGSLEGVEMLAVHFCEDAEVCAAQREYWHQAWKDRGAASVKFVRLELIDPEIHDFLGV